MTKLKLSLLGAFSLATLVLAQQESPADFCKRTAGAGYIPKLDPTGTFQGECEIGPVNICLGTEYAQALTGATQCCLPPQAVLSDAGKQGCCPPGQQFKYTASPPSAVCFTPPPPPPPVSCPASNNQMITRNGVTFKIFCQRYVREFVPPWEVVWQLGLFGNPAAIGNDDFEKCVDICSRNGACNGANFWVDLKNCSPSLKPPGNPLKRGSWYELPPPPSFGKNVISIVAVPKR